MRIYKTTVVTYILPILVTPENSLNHSESVNFTTFLILVVYIAYHKNMTVSAKTSHMADQKCNEYNLENLWYLCVFWIIAAL
jgi:hypothetical protein